MKKFLLTLIVTMLACLGAWAEDPSGEILLIGDGTTVYNSSNFSDFKLEGNNGAGIQAGDKLKVYYRTTDQWTSWCYFKYKKDWNEYDYFNLTSKYKETWGANEWEVQVFDVTNELATNIKNYGIYVGALTNCELLKVTYASAKATSLSASPASLTMYQGETKDVTVDFTPASAEFTITPSDGNISAVLAGHTLSITAGGETPVGDYTVTVTPQPGSQDAGGNEVQAVTININVKDKSIVETLNAQDVVEVAYGYPITIPVEFTPLTATNFDTPTCDVTGVTLSYSADHQKLTIDASGLSAETNGTITLSAGSISKEITLKVISPVTVGGIVITPSDDQTIAKGATLAVSAQVTPSNAANKDFSWNIDEYNNSIISYKDGVVTGKSRGTQALIATSAENSGITASINITVTEAFEGSINVPASTRVGVNSSSASVNITNGAVAEDYVVTYSSDHPEILEVNSSTGALTPKAEGTAKITAMIEASTAGQAKGFTNATFVSGDISVGAEIIGSFETFSMADMALGDQTEYAVSALPSVTWTPALSPVHPYEYITEWEIVDESGCLTSLWSGNDKKLYVAATKPGTTTAKLIAKYVQLDWTTNPAIQSILAIAEQEFNVTVSGVTGTITLAPQGDITFDSDGNITFDKKLGNQTVNATVNWSDGTTGSAVSVESNNEYANTTPSGLTITIQPVKKGSETVTVKAAWEKELQYPFSDQKAIAEATPVTFTVNVLDETKADVLTFEDGTTAKTVDVAKGYKADVKVKVEPAATALLQLDKTSDGGVTAAYDAETQTITLTAAADATGATFTLSDGVKSISVTAKIVEPVMASTIALDATIYTVAKDKTTKATATVLPVDASDLAAVWSSDNEEVFKVVDGVITGVARGTATLTAKSRMNESILATATVNVTEELPVTGEQPKSTFGVGETYTSQLTIAGMTKGTDYDVTYESDNTGVLSVTNDGELTAIAKGTANITVTFEPKDTEAAKNYTTWTRTMKVTVNEGVYGISIAATPTKVNVGEVATVTISSEIVTLNNAETTKVKDTDYTVVYSLEGASDDITVDAATGMVSIPASTSAQQFAIVATLEPVEAQKNNYKGAIAKTSVLVEGDKDAGVVLTKHMKTVTDEGGNTSEELDYIEVYVPTPGAFGSTLSETPTIQSSSNATIAELKAAANVKVTGLLANSDVQELVNLLGACDNVTANVEALNCKVLDMGEARMTEAITYTEGTANKCSFVSTTNSKSLVSVEKLTLPLPAVGVENGTVLPKGMAGFTAGWYTDNVSKLQSLTIPEGWTEIADEAWNLYGTAGAGVGKALEKVTSIKLPESLLRIGRASLAGSSVKTLFIPSKVTYIGDEAFNSAQHLQDVYFTGPAPRYVHVNAFAAENQMVNNTVDDNAFNGQLDPAADRSRYTVNGILVCIMHYPEEYKSQYVDETRIYKRQDPTILYDKGNATPENQTSYIPNEKWTADFIKYLNGLREAENHDATYLAVQYVDCGFKDVTLGYSYTWPSQGQMTTGYTFAHFGYLWSGDKMDEETQYNPEATPENGLVDRRGLYQFINTMGNAPESQEEWTFDFENDKWYTLCVPFNMTVTDIRKVFGPDTQVCRFSKVVRTVDVDEEAGTGVKKIYLEFRKDVMEPNGYAPADNVPYLQEHASDGGGLVTVYATSATTGIVHHVPYMIKPSGTVDNQSVKIDEETGARWFVYAGYEALNGSYYHDKVTSDGGSAKVYDFQGVTLKRNITKNSYVLSAKGDGGKHIFGFYKGALNTTTGKYEDGGTWNAYTATVVPEDGDNEYDTFFKDIDPTIAHAPVYTFYIDDEEPTGIEAYEIVCGNDPITDGKIYTVSGQRVNGINLTPGIYIKNGKKFIVK